MTYFFSKMKSPVGELTLVAGDHSLIAVLWEADLHGRVRLPTLEAAGTHPILLATEAQLREYFCGNRKVFRLPIEFHGSDFQIKVWRALQTIPYGTTRKYSELASLIGSPKAFRAVGHANGRNPISIVVPCHRVIGTNGKLTGFGGGIKAKAFLLNLESQSHWLDHPEQASL
ncbi:MAG: methylated-DNA--[protein]-cysteine S-methyltransferase [Acidobacteria bacterium]|nr:methylated-DNA--[protein]-cysteine S-methyltransferase [Acidobacteriota bacterium]